MKEDGGPAFPVIVSNPGNAEVIPGMTLRDWFAGQALVGCQHIMESGNDYFIPDTPEVIAGMAYKLADAMLAERNKSASKPDYMHDPLACTPDEEMA